MASLLFGIVDFLNLAKFLLFGLINFLFLDLNNILFNPNLKLSLLVSLLAVLSLLLSSLLIVFR